MHEHVRWTAIRGLQKKNKKQQQQQQNRACGKELECSHELDLGKVWGLPWGFVLTLGCL